MCQVSRTLSKAPKTQSDFELEGSHASRSDSSGRPRGETAATDGVRQSLHPVDPAPQETRLQITEPDLIQYDFSTVDEVEDEVH